MIRAILFDIDGTLLSLKDSLDALQGACRKLGIRVLTKKEILKYIIGYRIKDNFAKIFPEYPEKCNEFFKAYINYYKKKIKPKKLPYVNEILKKIKKKYKVGIVSTKSKAISASTLKKCKIPYDALITGEDVKKRKPDPEGIFKVCKKLKVSSEECIFVGDHRFDMQAAKRAGCFAIGILTGAGTKKELFKAGADKIIKNLKELEFVIR